MKNKAVTWFILGLLVATCNCWADTPSAFRVTISRDEVTYRKDITKFLAFNDSDLREALLGKGLLNNLKASSQILFLADITLRPERMIFTIHVNDARLGILLGKASDKTIKIIQRDGSRRLTPGSDRELDLKGLNLFPGDIISITRSELNDGGDMMP